MSSYLPDSVTPDARIDADYFNYPHRRKGLDHDRFDRRFLRDMPVRNWTDGSRLKLWVTVHFEHFPMDMPAKPFVPPGGMDRPYPSVWDFSTRDYGNRVGIFRLFKVLDKYGIKATAAMNSVVAQRYPYLLQEILRRDWEVAAAGTDMGHLFHGQMDPAAEVALVQESFSTLRSLSGQAVTGWHSPAFSQSAQTPDLVAAEGGKWIADWINDDMPYAFRTSAGDLTQMPLSWDLSDHKILHNQNMAIPDYEWQINGAFAALDAESKTEGARILSLSLSPWIIAQPSRIRALDRMLGQFLGNEGVSHATGEALRSDWVAMGGNA
ncbi:polysaccharide deacetylase [Ketogulonicigenium robustum]|uniref:Chitooligosaccharide deacetylase n=1 Tax=Ketogulonicigenium robustum TaxID=92947 RepID=A0A1W6NW28_9RHOB|nr:polysaccharide deacetylase family protein [Ketogulonicigenium robustum]ARO13409.1 polysaccharide deacetylase [Ketogulonicigenium robustum]